MKKEMKIREAAAGDLEDLAIISRATWNGEDYLERVSKGWIDQRDFFVGEIEGRVIACGKISTLPGEVAWLEGLRVHNDFKGKGYGRILSDEILQVARKKVMAGDFQSIEFSTYIKNDESICMAEKQGFRATELFHVLSMENPPVLNDPAVITLISPSDKDFSIYPEHAPCGWKYINHRTTDSLLWMKENAEFWKVSTGAKFLAAHRGSEISPLAAALDDPEGFIQGVFAFAEKKRLDYLELMIHGSHKELLTAAVKNGFSYWNQQGVANLPVYRFFEQP
ncbi:MAG: GNAT family N-acetyltransferase [Candidatus Fermentibacteria bacterium]|nr:GNAT family N-acetyltransferase [Candidatus Fermentibacteria bacterium]